MITDAEVRMHAAAARSAEGWEGSGGDAARSGLHSLNSWALGAATDAQTTLAALAGQRASAGELRTLMPPPDTEQVLAADGQVDAHPGDADREWALVDARAAAAEDARRVMEQYHYISIETRQTIDFWTTPPTVVVEALLPGTGTGPAGRVGLPEFGAGSDSLGAPSGVDGSRLGAGSPGHGPVVAGMPLAGGGPDGGGNLGGAVGSGGAGAGGPGAGGPGAAGGGGAGGGGAGGVGAGGGGAGGVGGGAGPAGSGVAGGGPGAAGTIVGGGGPALAGVPGSPAGNTPRRGRPGGAGAVPVSGPGGATPVVSRDALPPGAGGRGPRNLPGGGPSAGGAWPGSGSRGPFPGGLVGGSPTPTWRDVVAGLRGGGPGGVADPPSGPRAGGAPRPEIRAVATPPVIDTGRGSGTGHGFYPPVGGGTAGGQGESRRRASFLVEDSGVFDVDVPHTDPVIGAAGPPDPADRHGG